MVVAADVILAAGEDAPPFGVALPPLSLFSETAGDVRGDRWLRGLLRLRRSSSFDSGLGGVGLFFVSKSYGLNAGWLLSQSLLELFELPVLAADDDEPRPARLELDELSCDFFESEDFFDLLSLLTLSIGLWFGLSSPILLQVCASNASGLFFASS